MGEVAAIIVAAGSGLRAGGQIPKQFRCIGSETMLSRTLATFVDAPNVTLVQPVIRLQDRDLFLTTAGHWPLLPPVAGGATRQASVRSGLEALEPHGPDIVLIHDAARPFATRLLIDRAIAAVGQTGAAVPALPIADTVKNS